MQSFLKEDFDSWDRFYRANMVSSLTGFKPAMLVGTQSAAGQPNLALFQNIVHLGANPALVGLINRPKSASPHTIANIEATGWFTLNAVQSDFVDKAHQTSARYDSSESEFDAVQLTPFYRPQWQVPFVGESAVQALLKLVEIMPIQHNQTFLIIASIEAFFVRDGLVQPDGFIDLPKAGVICSVGLDGYTMPPPAQRWHYAKPFVPPTPIGTVSREA
jgi:flavin reductase (DIM6/NTAB) family NADH-FMN oxidoreductase RutF